MKDPCLTCDLPDCDEYDERCFYFKPLVQIERPPTRREMVKAEVTARLTLKRKPSLLDAARNADRVDQMDAEGIEIK